MAGQFLNGRNRRAAHGEMRDERVPQHVRPVVPRVRALGRSLDEPNDIVGGQRSTIRPRQQERRLQMPMLLQRRREPSGERNVPKSTALRGRYLSMPIAAFDTQLSSLSSVVLQG
jgi:hypothetical protein